MRTLTTTLTRGWREARSVAIACTAAAGLIVATSGHALAECPWIVQPHFDDQGGVDDKTLVNIIFDGLSEQASYLYGFTVTDLDLAWTLSSQGGFSDLGPHGRALDVTKTDYGRAFQLSNDSLEPHTVYLVAARSPVDELEHIDAAIEPSQPIKVSFKTRGATDFSGPLPRRSLPGVEIRASKSRDEVGQWLAMLERHEQRGRDRMGSETTLVANGADAALVGGRDGDDIRHDVQICAYQVAMR